MDFFEVVKRRASVRSFSPCEITDEELMQILDAGRRAPSGYNRQPWEFILIKDDALLKKLGKVQGCIAESSAAIGVVVDENMTRFWKEDASAAIENMLLAIEALGYVSLWVEGYVLKHEKMAKDVLSVPDDRRLLAILPVGKPVADPRQAGKKSLSELVHVNQYGQKLG